MSGWGSCAAATASFLFATAIAASDTDLQRGAAIFYGTEAQPGWQAVSAEGDYTFPPGSVSCAGCHGEDGSGAAEGGIAAPSLTSARMMSDTALEAWLTGALAGKGTDGRILNERMPRFTMADSDRRALAAFMRTLPLPFQQGVSATTLRIQIDTTEARFSDKASELLHRQALALIQSADLFGRRIELEFVAPSPDEGASPPPFATLVWRDRPATDAPIVVPLMDEDDSARCGSLLPGVEGRYRLLAGWIAARQAVQTRDGTLVNTTLPPIGKSGTASGQSIAFDLSERADGTADGTVHVYAGDLFTRMDSVRAITAEANVSVREASAVALYLDALHSVVAGLEAVGRRVMAGNACRAIRGELERHHAISLLLDDREEVIRATH